MTDKKRDTISKPAERAATNIETVRAEQSETGALDLEYPESAGLYGEVFTKYLPEVADELVDARSVRMLVEMEFNARRVQRMFDRLAIGQEARLALEFIRRDIECLLWYVCDTLSELFREQWGYEVPGAAHEWDG